MRKLNGKTAIIITIWATLAVIFHLYTSTIGVIEPRIQRSIHLLFLLPLAFILFPFSKSQRDSNPNFTDWFLAILSTFPSIYLIVNASDLDKRIIYVSEITFIQVVLGVIVVLAVLEACRRAVSYSFAVVVTVALLYIFISPFFSGLFQSRKISFDRIVETMYLATDNGIYGSLTGISTNILFVFITFAAFMLNSGVGKYFMDLSVFIAGRFRGGPAKISALSSGLYGSISGSSVADVYATGSFTIPLMRKVGYSRVQAGAIEAVSSAGGPLLPPVMGAAAFVMAEMTGTSYSIIVKSAILGATLYYVGIISSIHFEAVKLNIGATPENLRVKLKSILVRLPYFIPYITMVYFLFAGYSPSLSAVYAIIATFIIWLLISEEKITLKSLSHAINFAVRGATVIASALAGAGIIVAALSQTGAALAVGNIILKYSFDNFWLLLILAMLITLILGAGIPITPAYIITATIVSGAIVAHGVPMLSVHMFIFYFAILADISPPVGVASFSAASIANASPMKTALMAPKFAFAGFVVPFIFIINPELLMYDEYSFLDIIFIFTLSVITVIVFASVIVGYLFGKLQWYKRVLLAVLLLIIITNIYSLNWISSLIVLAFVGYEYIIHRSSKPNKESLQGSN